jgi:hypothetical protein
MSVCLCVLLITFEPSSGFSRYLVTCDVIQNYLYAMCFNPVASTIKIADVQTSEVEAKLKLSNVGR